MAVTVTGTPTQTVGASVSSLTWSFNATNCEGVFVGGGSQNQFTTSCTYAGSSMTELWDISDNIGLQTCTGYLIVSPTTGSNNVVRTMGGTCDLVWGGAVGLDGLETSSVAAAHRTIYTNDEAGGGSPSVTVADSENGDLVIDCAITLNSTITVGAGQTSRVEDDALAGGSSSCGVSTESATGANTVMSWTGGSFWAIGATALVASGGGAAGSLLPPPNPIGHLIGR